MISSKVIRIQKIFYNLLVISISHPKIFFNHQKNRLLKITILLSMVKIKILIIIKFSLRDDKKN
jgi:hypothetical protein